MVQQRCPYLQRVQHAGAVHLDQDVLGQVVGEVHARGSLQQVGLGRRSLAQDALGHQGMAGPAGQQLAPGTCVELAGDQGQFGPQIGAQCLQPVAALEADGQQVLRCVRRKAAQRQRQHPQAMLQAQQPAVVVVAAEEFITAVAAQRHRAVLAHQLADQEGGDHRRIGHRLVELRGQARNQVSQGRLGHQFGLVCAEVLGDQPRMRRFILCAMAREADREGADLPGVAHRHCGDQAGIHAAAEQHTHRHVGHHLPADGVFQQGLQFGQQGGLVGCAGAVQRWRRQSPVAPLVHAGAAQVKAQCMRGRQLPEALQHAQLTWHEAHGEVAIEGRGVDAARQRWVGHQCFEL